MRILILNGPNLNLLGTREVQMYGNVSFETYLLELRVNNPTLEIDYLQSNVEGELINFLHAAAHDGIILNAGGYTHTSVALRDAISGISIPVIEVHISNIISREPFRHDSMISPVCKGCIFGFGLKGYNVALKSFLL
jgi:3-dehydroquinate dehydratase-2